MISGIRFTLAAILIVVSTGAAPALAQSRATNRSAPAADLIVSTGWLGERLDDPGVVVIATGSEAGFREGHIPGAGFVAHMATLGGDHGLLERDRLAAVLSDAGARDDARVVIYGESAMEVGWLYMAFAAIGHGDHVSMLSGNMLLWREEGRPVSTSRSLPPSGTLRVRAAPDVIVDAAWVRERLDDSGIRLLDVRTVRERAAGYLPGSTLVLWQDLFSDVERMRFKSRDEIRALVAGAGLGSGQQVVTYCAIGMRASLMYLAARYAGVPARVYVGSWNDWRMQPGFPIEGGR